MTKRVVLLAGAVACLISTLSLGAEHAQEVFQPKQELPLTSLKWQRQKIRSMVTVYVRSPKPAAWDSLKAISLYKEVQENYNRLIDKMGSLIESGSEADLAELTKITAERAYDLEIFLKERTKGRSKSGCWENCRFMLDAEKLNQVGHALVAKYKVLPDPEVRAEQVEEEVLALKLPQDMNQLL